MEPVFAKLPSEPETFSGKQPGSAPVTISLPGNVRIEVSAFCPGELMAALIQKLMLDLAAGQPYIWHVGARTCARATMAWPQSSN